MSRFTIYMKRKFFGNDLFDLHVAGIVQGLLYGMCAIPCGTTLWDCELFDDLVLFRVDCTDEKCKAFMERIEQMYPGLCCYEKME